MGKIRIGIVGYGNIGRGVEQSIKRNDDMELKAVFTRRDPASVKIQTEGAEVKHFDDMEAMNPLRRISNRPSGNRTEGSSIIQYH